jgi:Asp-tRNA(Asn)/Glu-tRNA(Gln) amidotransferase C subunit
MQPKIASILTWFGQLQAVDVAGVVPAIHISKEGTRLRDDQPLAWPDRCKASVC